MKRYIRSNSVIFDVTNYLAGKGKWSREEVEELVDHFSFEGIDDYSTPDEVYRSLVSYADDSPMKGSEADAWARSIMRKSGIAGY